MSGIRFLLNGEPRTENSVAPTTTVLDWLRTVAHLTGTKEGCAEGDCGACTIVLGRPENGKLRYEAVNSCLMMLPQLDGCTVLTVEGLARDGALHPVQQAMVDTDGTQCGFCTPGFVMAMFAFHHGGEPADDDRIHEALAGNLCRCTGYRAIVEACRRIASGPADRFAVEATAAPVAPQSGTAYRHAGQVFLAPSSPEALFDAMVEHPHAIILGGGTDLGLRVSKEREAFPAVISTAAIAAFKQITARDDSLQIGAAVTYSEALPALDAHFPAFAALIRRIGSRQIRNLGTFAGNLGTASPIGDTLPCLITLDASVTVRSRHAERTLPVEAFITGYRRIDLQPGEVIAAIRIPFLPTDDAFAVYKVSKRFDQDISAVVAALRLTLENGEVRALHVAFGGMAAKPARAATTEAALIGRSWTADSLGDIDSLLARDFSPMSDHRASGGYRLQAAAGLLRRFQIETTSAIPVRLEAL